MLTGSAALPKTAVPPLLNSLFLSEKRVSLSLM